MSVRLRSDNLEMIHRDLLRYLVDVPDFESAPRGKPIREFVGGSFVLENPRNRLITSPARAVNYGFGVGELCWYVRGENDLETMLYYNRRMGQFSDDGKTINSAYGNRIFRSRFAENKFTGSGHDAWDRSQHDNVLEELRKDPDSRRAVLLINEPADLDRATCNGSKDVPCTLSLQLLIRDRKLHMVATMRSNDVIWGLPYDVFSFTCLQEAFLYQLQDRGVPVDDLGSYHHTAGSLHVYDTHFGLAEEVSKEIHPPPAPMKPFTLNGISHLAYSAEPAIRSADLYDEKTGTYQGLVDLYDRFEEDGTSIDWMIDRLVDHRMKRADEELKRRARDAGLDELARLTEEYGGYETKEKDVEQT